MSKSALLHQVLQMRSPFDANELLRKTIAEELDPKPTRVTIEFELSAEDLIDHKASNYTHLHLTPAQHLIEMIVDCLFSGGPLSSSEYNVIDERS